MEFIITEARAEHAEQLEQLQYVCFPTLEDTERFKAAHFLHHIALFPAGQLVALAGNRVIGATATIRMRFNFDHPGHTFSDIIAGGWLSTHDPDGDWLYGADLSVQPDARKLGVARALYAARQVLVHRLGLRGQVAAGMLAGFGAVKGTVSLDEYYADVVAGRRADPTLTAQLRVGFKARALLRDYLNDPICENACALIVMEA